MFQSVILTASHSSSLEHGSTGVAVQQGLLLKCLQHELFLVITLKTGWFELILSQFLICPSFPNGAKGLPKTNKIRRCWEQSLLQIFTGIPTVITLIRMIFL